MTPRAPSRKAKFQQFVDQCFPKENYTIGAIPGDAGQRSYFRVSTKEKSFVIMDCPPSYCSVQPFIDMAIFLRENKFSAPKIVEQDVENGFLLLEDFGTLNIKNYLLADKTRLKETYLLMLDLLVALQKKEPPANLAKVTNETLLAELKIFVDWYMPHAYKRELNAEELEEFISIWRNILEKQTIKQRGIVLRDYHVENMMHLEQKKSTHKLGLLDFQDALIGSPVYDLVSVLEDARIDVTRSDALYYAEYFAQKKKIDVESLFIDYHILGAQRNCRILGVFARKAMRDNDNNYLQYIPRVLKYLKYDLSHAALAPLKQWFERLGPLQKPSALETPAKTLVEII
jgi:hypothetical protein